MAYRRAGNLLLIGKECVFRWRLHPLQKTSSVICQTGKHFGKQCGKTARTLHTGAPSCMVAKLLSADELFAKTSLQEYLKKMQTEYNDCLRAVNSNGTEEQSSEEELRDKRTKLSLLAPLINSIRELDTKQREMAETVTLLKGETILALSHAEEK